MPIIYDQADDEVHDIARNILAKHHPELMLGRPAPGEEPQYVRLCLLMARQGDADSNEPAVKHDGYPCAAVVSVISYKQRVDKRADAEVIIDQGAWVKLGDRQRAALLDHEISHLEIQVDDSGFVKTDDQGRPKLKLRLHDWQCGGFRSIAERYGEDAMEVVEARKFEKDFGAAVLTPEELFA